MTPTSAERGRETRARLLDAAAQLIAEHGWGGVTTRKVAERAALRPGLVHYHFASIDDLLIEAALDCARREISGVVGLLAEAPDGPTGLERALQALTGYGAQDPETVVFSEMLLAATRHERLRVELAGLLRDCRSAVADWLWESAGVADPEPTAAVLLAVIDGLMLHRLIDPSLTALPVAAPLRRLGGLAGFGGLDDVGRTEHPGVTEAEGGAARL
ncbi:TetR/AcrR family transcriptional regulator [Streptomyces sp. URMC 123]|uniref:TetR/AcrR family transcriptional regulator n=1 Tax=Streptomyces sp. URMC 123 TaxID=3423403 RepID=UPI003F1D010C